MRISDWSSDVCSSDLKCKELTANRAFRWFTRSRGGPGDCRRYATKAAGPRRIPSRFVRVAGMGGSVRFRIRPPNAILAKSEDVDVVLLTHAGGGRKIGRASCRERVCQYV